MRQLHQPRHRLARHDVRLLDGGKRRPVLLQSSKRAAIGQGPAHDRVPFQFPRPRFHVGCIEIPQRIDLSHDGRERRMNAHDGASARGAQRANVAAREERMRTHLNAIGEQPAAGFFGELRHEGCDFVDGAMRVHCTPHALARQLRHLKDEDAELLAQAFCHRKHEVLHRLLHVEVVRIFFCTTGAEMTNETVRHGLRRFHEKAEVLRHRFGEMSIGGDRERPVEGAVDSCRAKNGVRRIGGKPLFRKSRDGAQRPPDDAPPPWEVPA